MNTTNSVNVKLYLELPGPSTEIRRFKLDEDVATNFEYLRSKVLNFYPSLADSPFGISWKDEENDMIAISSDEELLQALLYGQTDGLLRLYLRTRTSPTAGPSQSRDGSASNVEHPNVVCDGCDTGIRGIRFKCLVCSDYDLCSTCCEKGTHNHHYLLRMATPASDWAGTNQPQSFWWPGSGRRCGNAQWGPASNMRRFWRHMMRSRPENCPYAGERKGSPQAKQPETCPKNTASAGEGCSQNSSNKAEQRDFLQHVGEQVSAMLEPLGIAVDINVEDREKKSAGGPDDKKEAASGQQDKSEKTDNSSTAPKDAASGAKNTPMDTNETSQAGSLLLADDVEDSSWIKVEPKEDIIVITDCNSTKKAPENLAGGASGEVPTVKPSAPPPPEMKPAAGLYPSLDGEGAASSSQQQPKIPTEKPQGDEARRPVPMSELDKKVAEAVAQMKAMGFHDDGGWMTAMLYQNDGEIYKVIDSVLRMTKRV